MRVRSLKRRGATRSFVLKAFANPDRVPYTNSRGLSAAQSSAASESADARASSQVSPFPLLT